MADTMLFQAPIYTRLVKTFSATDVVNYSLLNRSSRQISQSALFWKPVSPARKQNFLYKAALHGNLSIVKTVVSLGAEQTHKNNALINATLRGNTAIFKFLVDAGADPTIRATDALHKSCDLLYAATLGNHPELVKLLIAHGLKPLSSGFRLGNGYVENNTVRLAAKRGLIEIVKIYLDAGCYTRLNPMSDAINGGSIPMVTFLIENGFNVSDQDVYTAIYTGSIEMFKLVKTAHDRYILSHALSRSILDGNREFVNYALEQGANPKILNNKLNAAIEGGNAKALEILLDLGLTVSNEQFITAARRGSLPHIKTDAIKLLLQRPSPPINYPLDDALTVAVNEGSVEMSEILLQAGAKVSSEHLNIAARKGWFLLVNLLVAAGADPRANNDQAFRSAVIGGQLNIIKYLVELGADINSEYGEAIRNAHCHVQDRPHILEYLESLGANYKEAVLWFAVAKSRLKTVKILLKRGTLVTDRIMKTAIDTGNAKIIELLSAAQK